MVNFATVSKPTVERRSEELDRQGLRFDLCLYNAGMDPFENCPTGGKRGITYEVLANRERMVFGWCRDRHLPVAFVLAGGYVGTRLNEEGLVELHRLTLLASVEVGGWRCCPQKTLNYQIMKSS